jgi:hypothetical protein
MGFQTISLKGWISQAWRAELQIGPSIAANHQSLRARTTNADNRHSRMLLAGIQTLPGEFSEPWTPAELLRG